MNALPRLRIMSVKVPVSDLSVSRRWYADVLRVSQELEWPDEDGTVRGVSFSPLGGVTLAIREDAAAAAATRDFGFFMAGVSSEEDLTVWAAHLDGLEVPHTEVMTGARGRLVGFHDPDGHELAFYAETQIAGARQDAARTVRTAAP